MPIRILIVDDHGLLRAGLRALMHSEEQIEVIGEAADGEQALRAASELHPDIVLLDLNLPDMDGIQVTRRLLELLPGVRILILTMYEDKSLLREALQAGASGYIIKRAMESELINAIDAVWRGDLYVHPAMTRALLSEQVQKPSASNMGVETLTLREVEILRLVAQGFTNKQIAGKLNISERTVENHRSNMMAKIGVTSRVELVRYAAQHGFLESGSLGTALEPGK